MMLNRIRILVPVFVLLFSSSLLAFDAQKKINGIMQQAEAPPGVVFEIADWEEESLKEAIPWVNQQIIDLRKRFPGLDIAVVSHGLEQFALLADAKNAHPTIHNSVQRLITDHSITLELHGYPHYSGMI